MSCNRPGTWHEVGVPTVRYSQPFLVSWLRTRLRRHNRQVLNFTALSLAGTVIGWGALYAVAQWLILLFAAIIRGPYASLPPAFPLGFAAVAGALVFSAWVDRKLTTNDLPPDRKAVDDIAMDFLLAIPRMTLAVPANLSAWVRLSVTEISDASVLIARLSSEQRMPLHEVPLEIPQQAVRDKVLAALLLLGVIQFQREEDSSIWLKMQPAARKALGGPALQ